MKLVVERFGNHYAVYTEDLRFKLGPNPLRKRAAQCVLKVIERMGVNFDYPQSKTAAHQNEVAIGGCNKLKHWLMNSFQRGQ